MMLSGGGGGGGRKGREGEKLHSWMMIGAELTFTIRHREWLGAVW